MWLSSPLFRRISATGTALALDRNHIVLIRNLPNLVVFRQFHSPEIAANFDENYCVPGTKLF